VVAWKVDGNLWREISEQVKQVSMAIKGSYMEHGIFLGIEGRFRVGTMR
jgi:hypothetical protein